MRNKIKAGFLLIFLPLTIIYNCTDPVSYNEIDNRLIGEWYSIGMLRINYPAPEFTFYGIQINKNNNINLLGIETNTGLVDIWKDDYQTIISANQGNLIIQYLLHGIGMTTDTFTYNFENAKLIIANEYSTQILKSTELGEQIFDPLSSNLSVKVDNVTYENDKISNYPSAFISRMSPSILYLQSVMDNSSLYVNVLDFNGPGSYEILTNNALYIINFGDYAIQYLSDSLSAGNITITEYDEINNVCSGTFYFNAIHGVNESVELKDGIFTVPLYK